MIRKTTDPGASRGRVIGEEAKPRVLLSWDEPARERVAEVLEFHAPTVREVEALDGVRQDDYDVLVTNRMDKLLADEGAKWCLKGAEEHLFVVSFAPSQRGSRSGAFGQADFCLSDQCSSIRWNSGYLSKSVEVPDDLLPVTKGLVDDDLVPTARSRHSHVYFSDMVLDMPAVWSAGNPQPEDRAKLPKDTFVLHPLLRTAGRDPRILAGWYRRSASSEGWALPSDVRWPWQWVAVAIRHWALTYRRFPLVGGWWDDPSWQTAAETRATETRANLEREIAEVTTRLQEEIAAATADLEDIQRESAAGRRRLLTDKGDSLKEATVEAFELLGYRVVDRDQEEPLGLGGKIEDLGVVDPDEHTFDPIIEVKGYDSGVKAGGVGQLTRHLLRARHSGRSPSAIWWVVNHWRLRSPSERGLVLPGENAVIARYGAEDVPLVLIDTTTLFRVIRAVEEGTLTPAHVRASLRAAKGRWEVES